MISQEQLKPHRDKHEERLLNFFIFYEKMSKRIYIVDDQIEMMKFLPMFYKSEGYETREFSNTGSLLEAIANGERPDLILMDTEMPGTLGYEICEMLKKAGDHASSAKIIGMSREDYSAEWNEAGADHFFFKPINLDALSDKTRELLEE